MQPNNLHPYQITLYRITEELGEAHQHGTSDEEANSPGSYDYDTDSAFGTLNHEFGTLLKLST